MLKSKKSLFIVALTWSLLLSVSIVEADQRTLRLHASTTIRDSGLSNVIIPEFEKQTGIYVEFQASGTGKALRAGRLGKADILWVHNPESEKQFIKDGFSHRRVETMYNDFILVGPTSDPAGIKQTQTITAALKKIYQGKNKFVSRADDSGTHKKEQSLWKDAGIAPFGLWYFEAGTGMKKGLLTADTQSAYTLTDRATWLANKHLFKLAVLHEGDVKLLNIYSLLSIDPRKHKDVNWDAAEKFIQFVTSKKGREIIASHKVGNENLFKLNPAKPH